MRRPKNQFSDQIKILSATWVTLIIGTFAILVLLALISFWTSLMSRQEAIIGSVIVIIIALVGGWWLCRKNARK